MVHLNLHMSDIEEILKDGVELAKRKKGVIEKGLRKGQKMIKIVLVELENYYKLIHVGRVSFTKKFKKLFK